MVAWPRIPEKLVKRLALLLRQLSRFARAERAQGYGAEAHPHQRDERMTDGIEHPAHLTVTSFVQRKIDNRAIARNRYDA